MALPLEGGVFSLNLGGIAKHQFHQIGRGRGGEDRSSKALADQLRRQTAVVHVGVGQQHGVELAKLQRAFVPVSGQIFPLLMHSAIDQHPRSVRLEVVLRSGNLPRAPQKLQLHDAVLSGCDMSQTSRKSRHSIPNCLTADRTVPSLRSRAPQSGTTVARCEVGLNHLRCEPPPLLANSRQPNAANLQATSRYFMEPSPTFQSTRRRRRLVLVRSGGVDARDPHRLQSQPREHH